MVIQVCLYIQLELTAQISHRKMINLCYSVAHEKGGFNYHDNDNLNRGIVEISRRSKGDETYQEIEELALRIFRDDKRVKSAVLLETEILDEEYVDIKMFKGYTGYLNLLSKHVYNEKAHSLKSDASAYGVTVRNVATLKDFPCAYTVTLNIGTIVNPYGNWSPSLQARYLEETLAQHAIEHWDEEAATDKQREKRYYEYEKYHDFYPKFEIPNATLVRVDVEGKEKELWINGSYISEEVLSEN